MANTFEAQQGNAPEPGASSPASPAPLGYWRALGSLGLWLVLGLMLGWGVVAIYYSNLPAAARGLAAAGFGVVALALLVLVRPRSRGKLVFIAVWAALVAWWLTIPPSN